jgi:hypothetical protein
MNALQRLLGMTALLIALPLLALADASKDNLEKNRQLLEAWRRDPEHYGRLRRDLQAFLALPPERQAQMRQLDRDLHEDESALSVRRQQILERYAEWLQRLPEQDRQKVRSARDAKERLRLVQQLRDKEWVDRLPKALQDELQGLPEDKRSARVAELRKDDRRRHDWRLAIRNWDEIHLRSQLLSIDVLLPELRAFVTGSLIPMLDPREKDRLLKAQGHWPLFPQVLVELADAHPIKLPGRTTGPKTFAELPPGVQERLQKVKPWPSPAVQRAQGKWPDYAIAVTQFSANHAAKKILASPLGESTLAEFSPAVQQFYKEKLLPALDKDEKDDLSRAEGKWPQFPRFMVQLSRKHGLQVPGMTLPGPRRMWDKFRITATVGAEPLPEVPDEALLEFVRKGMTQEERATLSSYSLADPASREQVKQLYYNRNPNELVGRRQAEQNAIQKKKSAMNQ